METPTILSPNSGKDKREWITPVRAIIRADMRQRKSQRELVSETGVPRRTIRRILKQKHSRKERKRKLPRHHLMCKSDIRHCLRTITKNWASRRITFEELKAQLPYLPSVRTIRRELARASYRCCIAYPRPYITRVQAKKRLAFAKAHKW